MDRAAFCPTDVKSPDHVISAAGNDGVVIIGKDAPDPFVFVYASGPMAFEHHLSLPLAYTPYPSLTVPAPGDKILATRRDIERADVVRVADKEMQGVLGGVRPWEADVDDSISGA